MPPVIAEAALQNLVGPVLRKIEKQLKEKLPARVICGSPAREMTIGSGEPKGEIRLNCKALFKPGHYKVFAEAVFQGVAEGTGFSGFKVSGNVWLDGDAAIASDEYAYTIRYNVWHFTGYGSS